MTTMIKNAIMPTAWAHLPNAAHIDRVLASLAATPELWGTAWDATWDAAWDDARGAARDAAWDAAWGAAWGAARGAAWDAAWGAARDAAGGAAWDDAWGAARGTAGGAIAALVAWDDCAVFLDMPPDAVRLVAASGHHPAVLLLPAAIVFNPSI
jgi:hypothetical protein